MTFKRSMGFWGMVFVAVSGMLGSGWLFAPYYSAQLAGPSSLLSWVIGAAFTLLIALTFAELTSMMPVSGSQARFMEFSHGTLASLIFNLVMWLGYTAVAPVETIGILQYLSIYFPHVVTAQNGVIVLSESGYFWAAIILLAMCILNFASIKWLARYNNVVAWLKIGMPFILIVVLLALTFHASNLSYGGFFPNGISGTGTALSAGGIIFSYLGFATAIVLAGEAKNVQKTIPRVLTLSILICMLVYILVQLAFIGALSPQSLSGGWSQLSFNKDASPFIGIIQDLHMGALDHLVFITAIVAPLGTAVIFIASTARITYAMSQNGYFPKLFLRLSAKGVPTVAVLLNFIVGLILFFPSPGWQGMMNFLVAALVFCYAIGPISLIALRKQLPLHTRRYKLPLAEISCIAAFFITNVILYWAGWKAYAEMGAFLVAALIVFLICRVCNSNLHTVKMNVKQSIWVFIYLIGLAVIFYFGQYKVKMSETVALSVLFVFSLVVFYLAKYTALPRETIENFFTAAEAEMKEL